MAKRGRRRTSKGREPAVTEAPASGAASKPDVTSEAAPVSEAPKSVPPVAEAKAKSVPPPAEEAKAKSVPPVAEAKAKSVPPPAEEAKAKSVPPPSGEAKTKSVPPPSDGPRKKRASIPPSEGGTEDDDLGDGFFAQGARFSSIPPPLEEETDPRVLRHLSEEVQARRQKNVRYVMWAVLAFALLGGGGLYRYATRPAEEHPAPSTTTSHAPPAPSSAASPTGATSVQAPTAAPSVSAAPALEAGASASVDAAASDAAPSPAASGDDAELTPEERTKRAKAEKVKAQGALDRGAVQAAIDAGERSVALDETDGEAWLLLGAAYQEKGRLSDAQRAYQACTQKGKRGPIRDCAAMIH